MAVWPSDAVYDECSVAIQLSITPSTIFFPLARNCSEGGVGGAVWTCTTGYKLKFNPAMIVCSNGACDDAQCCDGRQIFVSSRNN